MLSICLPDGVVATGNDASDVPAPTSAPTTENDVVTTASGVYFHPLLTTASFISKLKYN